MNQVLLKTAKIFSRQDAKLARKDNYFGLKPGLNDFLRGLCGFTYPAVNECLARVQGMRETAFPAYPGRVMPFSLISA
jgi:hypothetical protein